MMSDKDGSPLRLDGALRSGYGAIISNASKLIALLSLLVAALVSFTDVGFGGFGSREFTSSLLIMLASSYVIYFSLEEAGEQFGEESAEYKGALIRYVKAKERVCSDSIGAMRDFCRSYADEELRFRRDSFLAERGVTKEEYEAGICKGTARRQRHAIRRARKMKPMRLTPALLLSGEGRRCGRELENPGRTKLFGALFRLLPSTVFTIFTVSVMLTAKEGLSASVIIESILKLSTLPIIGFRGYRAGCEYVKVTKTAWLEAKCRLIESFLGGRGAVNSEPFAS